MGKNEEKDSMYVFNLKFKILKIILLICTILIPVLALLEIKKGDYVNFIIEIIFELPILIGLVLSLRGNFKVPSTILVVSVYLLATALSMIVKPTGSILVYRNVTYFMLALAMSIFFVESFKLIISLFLAMDLVQVIFIFGRLMPSPYVTGNEITLLIMSIALYSFIGFLLLETVSVSKRQASQLDKAKIDSQNQLEQMSTMVTGASENFESISNLSSNVNEINEMVKESVNAITKIDNQISQINIGSEVSTSAISKIGENIGNLNMSIGDLVKNQKNSTDSSNKMIASVEFVATSTNNEKEVLHLLQDASDDGSKQLVELLKNIQNVDENVKSIHAVVNSIQKIAEKTNLLAMNASIEAAHAGEAGKGFSVVATEIRKLAEESAKNSNRINDTLDIIMSSIEQVSSQSSLTKGAFGKITQGISKSVAVIDQIFNSITELTQNGEQLLNSIENVEFCANEIQQGGVSVQDAQVSLKKTQEELQVSVQELTRNSSEINAKNAAVLSALNHIIEISNESKSQAESLKTLTER